MRVWLAALVLVGLVISESGCASRMIAARMIAAPNHDGLPEMLRKREVLGFLDSAYAASWRVRVGPPVAELAVGVIEPADYRFTYSRAEKNKGEGRRQISWNANWIIPRTDGKLVLAPGKPRATLVLLHGYMLAKEMMQPWALYFAGRGYRVVLVDLRGHGRSTGDRISYGAWEAADLIAVADDLERRGWLVGRLGVLGDSYGAAVAIQWAARDRRVATVVALAPFSNVRTALPVFARGIEPRIAVKLSDQTFAAAARRAERWLGISWEESSVLGAVKQVRVPILFFHGAKDTWVLPENSEELAASAPSGSRRVVLADEDHLSLPLRFDVLGPEIGEWFGEKLTP